MEKISRRNFTSQTLYSLLTLSLVETLSRENLLAESINRIINPWLAEVEEISLAMKKGRAEQIEWQEKIGEIFARVERSDFLRSDEPKHLIIKPTLDRELAMGEASTTSDEKNNVHWFKATSDLAFTFNLAVYDIDNSEQFSGRQFYLDPLGGEKLGDGSLRVRHLTPQESRRLYGKS